MIDHISISVQSISECRDFYFGVMKTLGIEFIGEDEQWLGFGLRANEDHPERVYLSIFSSPDWKKDNKLHWCFKASSREEVDAFHKTGLLLGGRDGGTPGLRKHYHRNYYASFIDDPCGNRLEAVCHLNEI
ncbi:VOC family protein [Photobacterium sp. GJ3]|uniref:VOC family protein n=1 Tax=Photobacterium sp. GJ3 TaxID=2829502 RepID=UPI001B8BB924|nr:VOC family protein [Photobacterium sp. GJ3]QUJ66589.1 VOC family protein [Photobacterium sp. GJ3]